MTPSSCPAATPAGLPTSLRRRDRQAPFFPRAAVSLRALLWSALLGLGTVTPAIMGVVLFPLNRLSGDRALEIGLTPLTALLTHVILGPLLEEVIYRGLMFSLLRRYTPAWFAAVASSALFGLTHFPIGWGTVAAAFVAGCLLCGMVSRSGSLYPGLACHMAFNFCALFVISPLCGFHAHALELETRGAPHVLELFPAWMIAASGALIGASAAILRREFSARGGPGAAR